MIDVEFYIEGEMFVHWMPHAPRVGDEVETDASLFVVKSVIWPLSEYHVDCCMVILEKKP